MSFFTAFSAERDAAGNLVAELHMPIGIQLIGIATAPLVTTAVYVLARAPVGVNVKPRSRTPCSFLITCPLPYAISRVPNLSIAQ